MSNNNIYVDPDLVSRCRAVTKPGLYMILPETNRVESTIPNFANSIAQVLTTSAIGAHFIQYELRMLPNGKTKSPIKDKYEHFLFVIEGKLSLTIEGEQKDFEEGGFAYLPPDIVFEMINNYDKQNRVLWTRKVYKNIEDMKMPDPIFGNEKDYPAVPVDTYVEQHLIPYEEDIRYDLAFNLLNLEPGVHFGFVESHIMEHGLYMLQGRGIYWLNGDYHEVQKNDYIYMAPYCPQFYYTTGWEKTRYLLYKDVNRDYVENI